MKIFPMVALAGILMTGAAYGHGQGSNDAELMDQARQASMALGKRLKGQLQQAMKAGGPDAALQICNVKALPLSRELSDELGMTVVRTSLKPRNSANRPDSWQTAALTELQAMHERGVPMAKLEVGERYQHNGRPHFRYVKAIPTGKVCLTCHGSEINPVLLDNIRRLYPDDQAVGFKAGDLRGAFALSMPLSSAQAR